MVSIRNVFILYRHREIISEFCYIKPNCNRNYPFPIDFEQNGNPYIKDISIFSIAK